MIEEVLSSYGEACFKVDTGDVEDAPALDPLAKFDITEKNGAVYITGDEATIKASRRSPDYKCSPQGQDKVVIVGGYVINSLLFLSAITVPTETVVFLEGAERLEHC